MEWNFFILGNEEREGRREGKKRSSFSIFNEVKCCSSCPQRKVIWSLKYSSHASHKEWIVRISIRFHALVFPTFNSIKFSYFKKSCSHRFAPPEREKLVCSFSHLNLKLECSFSKIVQIECVMLLTKQHSVECWCQSEKQRRWKRQGLPEKINQSCDVGKFKLRACLSYNVC